MFLALRFFNSRIEMSSMFNSPLWLTRELRNDLLFLWFKKKNYKIVAEVRKRRTRKQKKEKEEWIDDGQNGIDETLRKWTVEPTMEYVYSIASSDKLAVIFCWVISLRSFAFPIKLSIGLIRVSCAWAKISIKSINWKERIKMDGNVAVRGSMIE